MTLAEVVVALGISGLAIAGIINGYMFSNTTAQMSALSLEANAKAMERIEETRAAKWDTASSPAVDQLVASNFPQEIVTLDVSCSGSGITYGTNTTQITQISLVPPLRRIRVDCVWSSRGGRLITNTIETCRAPDQ